MTNDLIPTLDKTINIMEIAPGEILDVHTKVHAIWNGIENGKHYDGWTLEDIKKIHATALTKLKEYNLPHIETEDSLDNQEKLPASINNTDVTEEISNKEIIINILTEKIKELKGTTLEKHSDTIPDTEEKKDINKLPKEVKSNIKDLLKFAKDKGCPECGSKVIRLTGFMEHGNMAKFGCVDCQTLWTVEKKGEQNGLATYKYEKISLSKKVWDKIYPSLIKPEQKFYKRLKTLFENMKNEYIDKYESGKKELSNNIIGNDDLVAALESEMSEIAYEGELTVHKDMKRIVPKALNPDAVKFIKGYSIKLAGDVSDQVKENIRLQIELGINEGAGVREIKNRIVGVFDKGVQIKVPAKLVNGKVITKAYTRFLSAETRARAIAQTETMRAFNYGRYNAIQGIDAITGWRFEASADEKTCPICLSLDGTEYKKDDDTNMPPNPHGSCRCTFSYVFSKKKQSEPKLEVKSESKIEIKKNTKPKFELSNNKLTIPNVKEPIYMDVDAIDKGWTEFGAETTDFKECFLHGKQVNGRHIIDLKTLKVKKADDEIPYVLSGKNYIPLKGISALPKGLMARIPKNLRWYEQQLQGEKAKTMIKDIRNLLFVKEEPSVKPANIIEEINLFMGNNNLEKDIIQELKETTESIEKLKVENQIKDFLKIHKCMLHKHAMSVDGLKLRKLEGWPQGKTSFKLPLPVEGTALTSGAFRGTSGEWIYYDDNVIKKSAPLLSGCQIRLDHSEDGSPLSTVIGWVTKSWFGKDKSGKSAIKYKGLIFDYDKAKDVFDKKIRKTSVSPFVKEKVDEQKGLIAEDIAKFEEISILSENNPACSKATVKAI